MSRTRLAAVALFAALPLAGCGNKGPLILAPEPQAPPPGLPAAAQSAPMSSSTVALPPPAVTSVPPAEVDGTSGTPR